MVLIAAVDQLSHFLSIWTLVLDQTSDGGVMNTHRSSTLLFSIAGIIRAVKLILMPKPVYMLFFFFFL